MSRHVTVSIVCRVCAGVAAVWLSACAGPAVERPNHAVKASYDKQTGRLRELTYDSNGNGRTDTWTDMDGTRPLRSRIDRNEDGRIDRWEEYDGEGRLVRLGFSRADSGKADAWAYPRPDGTVDRIEISSTADENRIDRWEFYDGTQTGGDGRGALVRAEEDTTGDGKPDRWETYEGGAMKTVAFDENGDGIADRRLTYTGARLVSIESESDGAGRFARRTDVR